MDSWNKENTRAQNKSKFITQVSICNTINNNSINNNALLKDAFNQPLLLTLVWLGYFNQSSNTRISLKVIEVSFFTRFWLMSFIYIFQNVPFHCQ